jgi:acetaldehyde dehydrogenase/alcohol dehydrogenase
MLRTLRKIPKRQACGSLSPVLTQALGACRWISSVEIDEIVKNAKIAEEQFSSFDQQAVDRIFLQISHEADKNRVPLARFAVDETKMGLIEDKVLKNGLAAELIRDRYKDTKTVGVISHDPAHGITKIAQPVGTVVCITPTTNPTSTAIAKSLFLAKTRNTGIFLPHPRAALCTAEAVRICHDAGVAAGAPENFIQCITEPSMEISKMVMNHPDVNLILATGGPAMVKSSYTCGHPAIGVGSGNAPVLVDETAKLQEACGSLVLGKSFDNGMICAAEQSVVVVDQVYDEFKMLLEDRGVYFLYGEEKQALEKFLIKDGHVNVDIVGQSAKTIAERINVQIPDGTVVLAAEEHGIGPDFAMSREKLSPVLAVYRAASFEDGVKLCNDLTRFGGMGHTAGIYTGEPDRVTQFAEQVPAGRILANMPVSLKRWQRHMPGFHITCPKNSFPFRLFSL